MNRPAQLSLALIAFSLVLLSAMRSPAFAAEITPFATFDQSPLVQIFGLPAPGRAKLLRPRETECRFAVDWSNDFAHDATQRESIMLDGEAVRGTLSCYRGLSERWEAGLELPGVYQSGGVLDGFLEGWHHFFHLPNGTRSAYPRNRLLYQYEKDGVARLLFTGSHAGLGDLRLTAATQLFRDAASAVALRGELKVPTGDPGDLSGSGSTDFALWVTADHDFDLGDAGTGAFFGALGAMALTRGSVLADQQRNFAGFGSIGAGWSPWDSIAFKLQLSSHSPFYKESDLVELNAISAILIMGGTIAFTDKTSLDLGVSEDVTVDRAPDISFHLSLATRF
ncbi:DUF3187 family protein [Geomonas sp. Red276]